MYYTYPNRELPNMPSVNRLVENAVAFVASNVQYQRPQDVPKPQRKMLIEVQQVVSRPHCAAAIKKVQDAIFCNETQATRDSKLRPRKSGNHILKRASNLLLITS
mmetsp:Transcript_8987/g.10392  ORF Transcript_8987/g.10392 Transcript_8987/m.10392 type:complete len:105 (+) Transcript_8987:19-333(+)